MCGGTQLIDLGLCSVAGLSPRVRGNREMTDTQQIKEGTIPACAGEPPLFTPFLSYTKDYPRVCGGTVELDFVPVEERGLSPRVRGNHINYYEVGDTSGTIPACAGEPLPV